MLGRGDCAVGKDDDCARCRAAPDDQCSVGAIARSVKMVNVQVAKRLLVVSARQGRFNCRFGLGYPFGLVRAIREWHTSSRGPHNDSGIDTAITKRCTGVAAGGASVFQASTGRNPVNAVVICQMLRANCD